tara:strand:- start:1548 stop:2048 length:501 start_codon:yes stop_codon:yes gene_type:complete
MKKSILALITLFTISCQNEVDLSLFNANKEVAQKYLKTYESPSDFETFKSLTSENITHQSPQYGVGEVTYDGVMAQAQFYMNGFEDVTFNDAVWLPGVDNTTLKADGSVRVYGTWTGKSIDSGKEFSVDTYHWFEVENGKISKSGDFFDATGMVMDTQADPVEEAE